MPEPLLSTLSMEEVLPTRLLRVSTMLVLPGLKAAPTPVSASGGRPYAEGPDHRHSHQELRRPAQPQHLLEDRLCYVLSSPASR